MRYIVITLIVANLIYFGWKFFGEEPAAAVVPTTAIDKTQIELVDDDSMLDEAAAPVSEPTPSTVVEAPASITTAALPTAEVISSAPENSESEPVTPVVAPPSLMCLQTPWTRDEKVLAQWVASVASDTIETLSREVETQRRFLIYIPAKKTEALTMQRLRELKELPIESAHINKGEFVGGISLGLFSQNDSAEAVLKKAHGMGIHDAVKTVRILTATEWCLRRHVAALAAEPWQPCAE